MATAVRATNVLSVVLVVISAAGCTKRDADAFGREMVAAIEEDGRQERAKKFGPMALASLVGAAAPPGGPLCLLGTDAGWQQALDASVAYTDDPDPTPKGPAIGFRMFFKAPPTDLNP
jgi:hypothetical protein